MQYLPAFRPLAAQVRLGGASVRTRTPV